MWKSLGCVPRYLCKAKSHPRPSLMRMIGVWVFQVQEFGVCEVRDLKPNGANILVTEENKKEYVHLVCQMRMTGRGNVP